jgi:hypothetical protein
MWDVVYFKKLCWHSSDWVKENQKRKQSSTSYTSKNLQAHSGTSNGSDAVSIFTKEVFGLSSSNT